MRGKVKKAAAKIIEPFYQIFPGASKYARHPNSKELVRRHIEQRVGSLLGGQAMYLMGYVDPEVRICLPNLINICANLIFRATWFLTPIPLLKSSFTS